MTLSPLMAYLDRLCEEKGVATDYGCSENEVETYKRIAKSRYPDRPICVVADWRWLDFQVCKFSSGDVNNIEVVDEQQICAKTIIEDQADRQFNSVITSKLNEFSDNCIFLTRNTAYILVGSGYRVSMPPIFL
mgnify:CR=1 FL=1